MRGRPYTTPPGCPRGRACAAGAPLLMAKAGGKPPGALAPGPRGLWRRRAVQDRHKPKWRPTRPIVGTSYGSFAFAQAQKLTPSAVPPLPTEPALARWASVGAPAGVVPGAAAPWAARVDYPASHETGCAVPAWPAGPPRRHASEEPRRSSPVLAPSLRELSAKLTEGVFSVQLAVAEELPPPPSGAPPSKREAEEGRVWAPYGAGGRTHRRAPTQGTAALRIAGGTCPPRTTFDIGKPGCRRRRSPP